MKSKKKKILVLGYFGYVTDQLDGQTVKTRDVYRLIREQYGEDSVDYFDTQEFQRSKLSVLTMFGKVCRCNRLVYLPAHNNLKFIFPIIYILSLFFRFSIDYFVVGGWLCEFLKSLPLHRAMLRRIRGIHVETRRLQRDLEKHYGYKNVDIFPNFRFFDFQPVPSESETLRLVFMARVNRQKGLDWIFRLAEEIQARGLENRISITFYGPINDEDQEYFTTEAAKYPFVSYRGALQPSEIHRTLSEYDAMLLPTHYYTEGLPGSIVDAYIAGIPVVVTEWMHSREFVEDGRSGFIVPFEDGYDEFVRKVMLLNEDRELLKQMKLNALEKRNDFTPPPIINLIY